jgi:hypothetical protein
MRHGLAAIAQAGIDLDAELGEWPHVTRLIDTPA